MVSTHYMDEAERCHDIAYIAYGKLMARGTVDEVIGQSGLTPSAPRGRGPTGWASELKAPGVAMAAPFGAALHVSGPTARRWRPPSPPTASRRWSGRGPPTLEDVFIQLMATSKDNFQ
jgi:ABC-2 type transport system ATP-binding protein